MSAAAAKVRQLSTKPADHWMGYVVALSGALMQMMSYGVDNSFSMFSSSMQEDASLGYPSATTVSFGNSVSLGLSPVFGVLAGFLVDRVPPRAMMLFSTITLFAGLWLASSFATSSVGVTFSYCLLASISSAAMLSPGAAATGSWFHRRLGLGQGITFAGGGIGSSWIPSVLGQWIEPYGWRKTFKLMSCFCAIGLVGSIFSCRRHEPRARREEEYLEQIESDVSVADEGPEPIPRQTNQFEDIDEAAEANMSSHDALMHALHTRRLKPKEILRVFLTQDFLANFAMFAVYGWAFYGMIYLTVPYVSSMGSEGTVYQNEIPISTAKASTVFTFWGVFQIVGSILVGGMASFTVDAFAYTACASVGGLSAALLAFCRTYAGFAACLSVIGFCTAGIFAVMPALIAKAMYGPNLGFFMGCIFVAGCLGGFSAPPIQAKLQEQNHGNYSYGCIFVSCCFTAPGIICYLFQWPNKRNLVLRSIGSLFRKDSPAPPS